MGGRSGVQKRLQSNIRFARYSEEDMAVLSYVSFHFSFVHVFMKKRKNKLYSSQ
jgi:hypothetical protein